MWITGQLLVILNLIVARELNASKDTTNQAEIDKTKSALLTLFEVYAKFVQVDIAHPKYCEEFLTLKNWKNPKCPLTKSDVDDLAEGMYAYYSQTLHTQGGYTKEANKALLGAVSAYLNTMSSSGSNFVLKGILTQVKESLKMYNS